jgi:hypothetical protein
METKEISQTGSRRRIEMEFSWCCFTKYKYLVHGIRSFGWKAFRVVVVVVVVIYLYTSIQVYPPYWYAVRNKSAGLSLPVAFCVSPTCGTTDGRNILRVTKSRITNHELAASVQCTVYRVPCTVSIQVLQTGLQIGSQ